MQNKLLKKEALELRHEIDLILSSKKKRQDTKKNWEKIDRLVEISILLAK